MAPGKDLAKSAAPHIKKIWSGYTFQKGVIERQLSPFELNIAGGLFKNAFEKAKFKVQDNIWLIGPPVLIWAASIAYVKKLREDYLFEHRY